MTMLPPGQAVRIRYAESGDARPLAGIDADAADDAAIFRRRLAHLDRAIRRSRSPFRLLLVLEHEDSIAGFVRAVARRTLFPRNWWLEGLEIKAALRRNGFGQVLIREALHDLYYRGCRRVFLEVDRDNFAARAFYEKLHFIHARGPTALMIGFLHSEKEVLSFDLAAHHAWISPPSQAYRYSGVR
ncbi:MAG: GNAT family N-acetyltransferase [Planctomycetota bacterium]